MTDDKEFYRILVEDHVKTREFSTIFLELIEQNDVKLLAKTLKSQQAFLLPFMTEHFAYEENIVFPAIISAHNNGLITDKVLALTKEHGELLVGVSTMVEIVDQGESKCLESKELLFSLTKKMCLLACDHESREDELYSQILLSHSRDK